MANRDIPSGFTQIQSKVPSSEPFVTTRVVSGATIYKGAVVTIGTDGTVTRDPGTAGAITASILSKGIAMNGGVAGASIQVCTKLSDITCEVQCDENNITSDVRGQSYDLVVGADNTVTEQSGIELDDSTGGGAVCKVTDMIDRPDNDVTLANNKVRVEFI
jgi:hypothetical protein